MCSPKDLMKPKTKGILITFILLATVFFVLMQGITGQSSTFYEIPIEGVTRRASQQETQRAMYPLTDPTRTLLSATRETELTAVAIYRATEEPLWATPTAVTPAPFTIDVSLLPAYSPYTKVQHDYCLRISDAGRLSDLPQPQRKICAGYAGE